MKRVFVFIVMLMVSVVSGQPGGGGDPGHGAVPIGGIEILIALGAALGIKKLYSSRKKETH